MAMAAKRTSLGLGVVTNLPLLLESPERLIRRLAAELIARDREEWNAKAKADDRGAKARWVVKNRKLWSSNNSYRRMKGLPPRSFERYMAERGMQGVTTSSERRAEQRAEREAREARYQRLKERLKTLPKASESRASVLGIRTPKQMREATMENESVQRHILDKLVRQEGAAHLGAVGRFGWYSLGEGCHWKGRGRGWR